MLASVELKKRENRDDIDLKKMKGYVHVAVNIRLYEFGHEEAKDKEKVMN
jgi:hypothetical protein